MDPVARIREKIGRYGVEKRMGFTPLALQILAASKKVTVLLMLLPLVKAIAFTFGDTRCTTEGSADWPRVWGK